VIGHIRDPGSLKSRSFRALTARLPADAFLCLDNYWPLMQIDTMAVSLTPQNKQTLKRLLKTGRWNNESEILRYGLRLVEKELTQEAREDLSAIPAEQLARALRQLTPRERAEERRMARASLRHRPRAEDLNT